MLHLFDFVILTEWKWEWAENWGKSVFNRDIKSHVGKNTIENTNWKLFVIVRFSCEHVFKVRSIKYVLIPWGSTGLVT